MGFGTAVAIPASMLAGVGLNPFSAVLACLVANTTPTAYGSVGMPLVTLSSVTGIASNTLALNTAIIEGFLCFISPFIMVCIIGGGIKALKGVFIVTLVAALSFTLPAYITAATLGAELPNIVGSTCSILFTIVAAKVFNKNPEKKYCIEEKIKTISLKKAVQAWCPFILILVMLMITSTLVAPIHDTISVFKTTTTVYAGENGNKLTFSWINTPGVIIFISAIIGGFIQKAKVSLMIEVLLDTLKANWKTLVTICAVMATAKVMGYSGMISDIATFLVIVTGGAYPFIWPLIGAIGAFVTGYGTLTSVLF